MTWFRRWRVSPRCCAGRPRRPGLDARDPPVDDARRLLLSLAEDGGAAAGRVLAYLRELRGAGDGELRPRYRPAWAPGASGCRRAGNLFGAPGQRRRTDEVPQPRRSDPGE